MLERSTAIVGGGPAGLMAAEAAAAGGARVDVYDAMPSMGRKFLLAGKGGLNLTHSEPLELVPVALRRAPRPARAAAGSVRARSSCATGRTGLGIGTFVG